ncbi:MAG TPA: hypothetical protein DCF68_09060 [Cyanothece sp. UBA12306]|nr:hypothetical protein [Cyanothece sp. UBA12306]
MLDTQFTSEELTDDNFFIPDAENLITEDDTPVDNFASEKQQRLLTTVLYNAKPQQTFIASANVGIYHTYNEPPIVPDVFLSLEVAIPENWWKKANRCYMMWQFGKSPEVVIEIVSNQVGGELDSKLEIYQRMRISYYVVYDPACQISDRSLRIFELRGRYYQETQNPWLEQVELGLTLWQGTFENREDQWLRWCDQNNQVLPTGDELAQAAQIRVQEAENRAEKLAAKLRDLGVNTDDI